MKLLQPAVAASALLAAQAAASLVGNDADVHKRALLGLDAIWANVVKQSGADLTTLCQGVMVKTSVTQTNTATETIVSPTTTTVDASSPTRMSRRPRRAVTPAGTAVFNALYQLAPALVLAQCRALGAKPATTTVATVTTTTQTTTRPVVTATASLIPNGDFSEGLYDPYVQYWSTASYGGFTDDTDADPEHGKIATLTVQNLQNSFGGPVNLNSGPVSCQPNTDYTLAFDIRHSGATDTTKWVYPSVINLDTYEQYSEQVVTYDDPAWSSWTTVEKKFNSQSATTLRIDFYLKFAGSIDNVRLIS